MNIRHLVILAAMAPGFGAYQYYYTDHLASRDAAKWVQNGSLSTGSGGLTSSTSGSLISSLAVPDGSSNYEVKMTLALTTNGGNFFSYLRASANSLANSSLGTFYASYVANPTFSGAACSATLYVIKGVPGTVTTLSAATIPCHSGMVVRSVYTASGNLIVYIDNAPYAFVNDTSIAAGQPGVGVSSAPAGNSISEVDLGPLDRIAPAAVNAQRIGNSPFSNRVDMQWQGVLDDSNGTGVASYQIYRNGVWLANTPDSTISDTTVSASTTYTYQIQAVDYHWNSSNVTFTVTTPVAGSIDPREIGVRPSGSYWGASGENLDLRSGNLNFSVPLVKAQGRGGWGVGFNLSYNSQNWRQDSGGTWQFGRDVGYGYGWRLQAGSLTPIYQSYFTIHHYVFADATGAEYRLDQNNNGVWTSNGGIYVSFDSNSGRLYFNDGSFWLFGSQSAGAEQDAGTLYPTLMQDTNGNQVIVRYNSGLGVTWTNSSSRIQQIEDVRGGAYAFTYNTDAVPHLTSISNTISTLENYSFSYTANLPLYSPFPPFSDVGGGYDYWSFLQSITTNGVNLITGFAYDATLPRGTSGELTQVTLPYNGHLRWEYVGATLSGRRIVREVANRYLLTAAGATETQCSLQRSAGDTGQTSHAWADLLDWNANAEKAWFFQTDGTQPNAGLQTAFEERQLPNHTPLTHQDYTWTQGASGNLYIGAVVTTLDPGQAYSVQKKTTQVLDAHGNVTQMQLYDFGNLATPARTYTNTYLTDPNYTSRYIFNRLSKSVLTSGAVSTTLVQNSYDGVILQDVVNIGEHDPSYGVGFPYRGNVSVSITPSGTRVNQTYDTGGNVIATSQNGVTMTSSVNSSTNYAVPSSIITGSFTTTANWTSFLGLSSMSGPNGDTTSINYDANARPQTSTSPFGAITTYTYNDNPPAGTAPNKMAATLGRFTKTSYDGLGRTIRVETGDASGTKSQIDTVYNSCGCTPLGKMTQQSMPYAPGATPVWTSYTYDAIGRTLTITAPDSSITNTYAYQGNTVSVKDAVGKWKQFRMDGMGNLASVVEPNPAITPMPLPPAAQAPVATLGTNYLVTSYAYDILNHLTQASMSRGTTTQTRTFNYTSGGTVGPYLLRATNPENGTVSYTYNADGTQATKTDAKGQQFTFGYDSYKRPTTVSVGGSVIRTYIYDNNSLDAARQFSHYGLGRLVAIQHAGTVNSNGATGFIEMFSYTQSGSVAAKRLRVTKTFQYPPSSAQNVSVTGDLDTTYAYDTEGKVTTVGYPAVVSGLGPSYTYSFDSLGRPNGLTDNASNAVVSAVQYGPANEMLQMSMLGIGTETRKYNSGLQLTNISIPGQIDLTYTFDTSLHNDGKILSQKDAISGEQISYLYDSLSRLLSATGSGWSQSYQYDGFGNLLARNATGTAPASTFPVDPATNRLSQYAYDTNGNLLTVGYQYDAENRLVQAAGGGAQYFYDASNKRIWQGNYAWDDTNAAWNFVSEVFNVYGANGQMLGSYQPQISYLASRPNSLTFYQSSARVYFGRKLIAKQDRLGSVGRYHPYGEERNSPPLANDQVKFATYTRDSTTGMDYADQRYYASAWGRFMTVDPYRNSAGPQDPGSWNRYAYTRGDPINRKDPYGLCDQLGDDDYSVTVCGDGAQQQGPGGLSADASFQQLFVKPKNLGPGAGGGDISTFGATTKPMRVTDFSNSGPKQDAITSVLEKILDALSSNTDCSNWLRGETSAADTINAFIQYNSYGYGTFNSSTVAAFEGYRNKDGSLAGVPMTAAFTINANGAFFNSNDPSGKAYLVGTPGYAGNTLRADATILIHELAHILGAAGFKSDFDDSSAGKSNDSLVNKNCGKLIGKLQ